jgi:HEAT repeat protein
MAASAWDYITVFASGGENPPNMEAQFDAIANLTKMGDAAVGPLLAVMNHENKWVRANAATALGRIKSADGYAPLVAALEDEEPDVRASAAEALGWMGDKRAVRHILLLLESEEDMDLRGATVALGWLNAADAADEIIALLASESWEVRWRAAIAAGRIGDVDALGLISVLSRDDNPVVLACAVWAQGELLGTPNYSALKTNLWSLEAGDVYGAAWALGVIKTEAAEQILIDTLQTGNDTAKAAAKSVLHWLDTPQAQMALEMVE